MMEGLFEMERSPVAVKEEVATFAKVLTPEKYGMFPCTAAVEVERPPKESVSPVRMTGQVEARFVSSEMSRPDTSAVPTVAQVAAPSASRERTNWLVQEAPVYSAAMPVLPVSRMAEVMESISSCPEMESEVVVAFVVVALVVKVEEAISERGEPVSQSPVDVAFTV